MIKLLIYKLIFNVFNNRKILYDEFQPLNWNKNQYL